MTMMSDLGQDLVEEILSRVPITCLRAVRSTCKRWNGLWKDPSFRKKHCGKAAKDSLVIMMSGYRVCLMSVNLNGIHNHKESIKRIGELNQVNVHNAFYCDGLLLCLTKEEGNTSRLVVWNPYLGQTRWIAPRSTYGKSDMFGIGYNNHHNHKILRLFNEYGGYSFKYEIYDFKSNSWRVLITSYSYTISSYIRGCSLKGNTYFLAWKRFERKEDDDNNAILLCFDFTRERFEAPLHLPLHCDFTYDDIDLSTVREEQLAVLFHQQKKQKMEIWVTTKVEPNAVSWNKFLAVDMETITRFEFRPRSFFVDEEKKVAVICEIQKFKPNRGGLYQIACIIGENGYIKEVDLGQCNYSFYSCPFVCSLSYVPSLVYNQSIN